MDKLVLPQGVGVVAVGLKTGLVLPNDDIAEITADTVAPVVADKDIICITEAVVARSQNQYVTCTELAADIKEKLNLKKGSTLAVISPIASRNRFSLIMKALALATEGGKVIVQLTTPYDEVGNQVMDEEYSTTRFRLKRTLKSLREARGNTPQFNVLIREIIAGLKLQEMGYNIISIRKITGQGIADLTVRTPEGRLAVIEVTFEDLAKAARKAVGIQRDVPEAEQALAVAVNLELKRITLVDANQYLTEPQTEPIVLDYGPQLSSYYEPDVIYPNELGERSFSHPITKMDYREVSREIINAAGARGEVIFTNNPLKVYDFGYIDGICIAAVHDREKLRELFQSFGRLVPVITLQDIGPGHWGVIGSNISDMEKGILKLLPEDASGAADRIKDRIKEKTGKSVEVLIFGDGAYKDPDTGIYELADPHPAIGVSEGLRQAALRTGSKLKLQVDTLHSQGYSREEIAAILAQKDDKGEKVAQESLGTTPRSVTSILGTLADLVAGSADAGTPIVLIRGFEYTKG